MHQTLYDDSLTIDQDKFDDDSLFMKNPNLYVTLAESEHNGYLLKEDGALVLLESGDNLFT